MSKHVYNLKRSTKVVEATKLTWSEVATAVTEADLRGQFTPVVSQLTLGSCTSNAIVSGLREFLEVKSGKYTPSTAVLLSRLFLYYEERLREGTVNVDAGANIVDGMQVLLQMGVPPEQDEPYIVANFTEAPSQQDLQAALAWRVSSIHPLADITEVKRCLADGFPAVMGFEVFESFESPQVAQTGIMTLPQPGEASLGGHAVTLAGFSDAHQWFIVRNSWGKDWGDAGYFYMPYEYFLQYAWDFWTARVA